MASIDDYCYKYGDPLRTDSKMSQIVPAKDYFGRAIVFKIALLDRPEKFNGNQAAIENDAEWRRRLRKTPGIVRVLPIRRKTIYTLAFWHSPVYVSTLSQQDGEANFLVMPRMEGGSLETLLKKTGKLDVLQCLHVGYHLAKTLAAIHDQDCVYRDLKNSNILFEIDPAQGWSFTKTRPLLTDFGIATQWKERAPQPVSGSPHWMPPEVKVALKSYEQYVVEPSIDVYALGLLICYMLTGHSPYMDDGRNTHKRFREQALKIVATSDVPNTVKVELGSLIENLLHDSPSFRPSAKASVDVLSRLLGQAGIPEVAMHGSPRRLTASILMAAVLVALLSLGVVLAPSVAEALKLQQLNTPTLAPAIVETRTQLPRMSTVTALATVFPIVQVTIRPTSKAPISATNTLTATSITTETSFANPTPQTLVPPITNGRPYTALVPFSTVTLAAPITPSPPTPKPARVGTITLGAPENGGTTGDPSQVFSWSVDYRAANQCYEFLIWSPDNPGDKRSPSGLTQNTTFLFKFTETSQPMRSWVSSYKGFYWGVRVMWCYPQDGKWMATGVARDIKEQRIFYYNGSGS